jgi:hypothetical protein
MPDPTPELDDSASEPPLTPITPEELDLLSATFHAAYAYDPLAPPHSPPPPPFSQLLSPQANAFRRGTAALVRLLGLELVCPNPSDTSQTPPQPPTLSP